MRKDIFLLSLMAQLVLILIFAGCEKKSGEAIVLEKEHIAAKKIEDSKSTPPTVAKDEATSANEITVDQYVMDPAVRGTDRDPRATNHEQWIVKVRMTNGRQFNVQSDQSRWEKLKEGDRVFVTYRQGKYTGTVWDSEIR